MSPTRLSAVKTPNGPSAKTRVPIGMLPNFAVWSPRFLTVIRNESPLRRLGERERMLRVPEALREEAPEEELAGLRAEPVEPPAADPQRDDARGLLDDLGDPQVVAAAVRIGRATRK